MGKSSNNYLSILFFITLSFTSCKKYLDASPDKSLIIPQSISDLQAVLDNSNYMNLSCSSLGEVSADNYYITFDYYQSQSLVARHAYVWDTAIYNTPCREWNDTYVVVYNANLVLEGINTFARNSHNQNDWDNIKGSALLFRAKSFLAAIWTWAKPYDSVSANSDLGIPLRVSSDFNIVSVRSSIQQCYERIIADLKEAIGLLPTVPLSILRPSKPAAYGLLARTYLSMRQYDSCLKYTDLCLSLYNQILDYNTIDKNITYPIKPFNKEIIMYSRLSFASLDITWDPNIKADSLLYNSYDNDDLRKEIFYYPNSDGTVSFQGSYDGSFQQFNGLATDEVYLMKAECLARIGNISGAMDALNTLLNSRWKSNTFAPLTASNEVEALRIILRERRKELVFRDLRWMDIKRLNKEGANIQLTRSLNGQTFELQPNESRYALPFPSDIIILTGMPQNGR